MQEDIAANQQIRAAQSKPVAMHFDNPPLLMAVREGVCDAFVVGGGASALIRAGALCGACFCIILCCFCIVLCCFCIVLCCFKIVLRCFYIVLCCFCAKKD